MLDWLQSGAKPTQSGTPSRGQARQLLSPVCPNCFLLDVEVNAIPSLAWLGSVCGHKLRVLELSLDGLSNVEMDQQVERILSAARTLAGACCKSDACSSIGYVDKASIGSTRVLCLPVEVSSYPEAIEPRHFCGKAPGGCGSGTSSESSPKRAATCLMASSVSSVGTWEATCNPPRQLSS